MLVSRAGVFLGRGLAKIRAVAWPFGAGHARLLRMSFCAVGSDVVDLGQAVAGYRPTRAGQTSRLRDLPGGVVCLQFTRCGPNQLWFTDITEHHTREGKVYCAVVLDTYSRRVVGWSIDSSPTAALVTNALGMAIDSRRPKPGGIIHSGQGTQFGSWAFTERAKASGLVPSMGSVGDC